MKHLDARATIYLNEKFLKLLTMSQGSLDYAEPSIEPFFLPPDIDDEILGATLRLALAGSKKVSAQEFLKIFHSGIVQEKAEAAAADAMRKYGYKTKRAMYKNMNNCSIDLADGKIKIQPMHHKSIDGYSATKDGPEPLTLDASISDAELGAALREGFKRCTSAV